MEPHSSVIPTEEKMMFMPTEPVVMPMHPSTANSMQPAVPSEQARANAESIPKAATIRGKSSLRANIVQIASCLDVQQEKELDVSGLGKFPPPPSHPILVVVMSPSEILDFVLSLRCARSRRKRGCQEWWCLCQSPSGRHERQERRCHSES